MNSKIIKGILCAALTFVMILGTVTFEAAANKPDINMSSAHSKIGYPVYLKVLRADRKVKWSSSNTKVAKIDSTKGKHKERATVKCLKGGKALITAKLGKAKFKCKVYVKKKAKKKEAQIVYGECVYISSSGKKYHRADCSTLRSKKFEVQKSWAIANGYEPCRVCNP